MATTTNFGWETPDDTDLVKDGAAAIRTALGGVDTSFVDLKGGTTGQVLAKASATDLDFTWATDASGIPATIFDAKGDIIAASAADTAARLAVGTNGQVLTADSTAATGIKWATAGAAAKSWSLLSTTTLSGGTTTVSGISGQGDLMILINSYRGSNASAEPEMYFNGDTSAKYNYASALITYGSSYAASMGSSNGGPGNVAIYFGRLSNNATDTNTAAVTLSGCNSSGIKTMSYINGAGNGAGNNGRHEYGQGAYSGTSTISSVSFKLSAGTFAEGTMYIYGAA